MQRWYKWEKADEREIYPGSRIYEEIGLHLHQEGQTAVFSDGNRPTCHGKIARREKAFCCCLHDQICNEDGEIWILSSTSPVDPKCGARLQAGIKGHEMITSLSAVFRNTAFPRKHGAICVRNSTPLIVTSY